MLSRIEDCIPALRRYALALLRDRQDADDLVHDCLVRALEKLHTRRDDVDTRAWLFTIMHNLFVSQRRRAKVRLDTEVLEEKVEGPPSTYGEQE
jgi:RNA polymerase sigma-70 factor (ECF subfamily)